MARYGAHLVGGIIDSCSSGYPAGARARPIELVSFDSITRVIPDVQDLRVTADLGLRFALNISHRHLTLRAHRRSKPKLAATALFRCAHAIWMHGISAEIDHVPAIAKFVSADSTSRHRRPFGTRLSGVF